MVEHYFLVWVGICNLHRNNHRYYYYLLTLTAISSVGTVLFFNSWLCVPIKIRENGGTSCAQVYLHLWELVDC